MTKQSKIDKAKDILQEDIVACFNCRPWIEDAIVWNNPHTDLYDLLIDLELSDDEWKIILEDLYCPHCGHPLQSRCDQVEIKSEYDYQIEEILKKIEDDDIIVKLYEFNKFISAYPYLGLTSPTKIGEHIFKLVEAGKVHAIESEVWYRARKINNESRIFSSEEMGAPDPQKDYIPEGRFNHTGQAFLYLAEIEKTAFLEIKEGPENICTIQEFQIRKLNKLLDLRSDYDNIDPDIDIIYWAIIYNGFVGNKPDGSSSWKPEYFVPRYIADVARFFKYDGIIFSSAIGDGSNLVLFNNPIENVYQIGESRAYYYKKSDVLSQFIY